MDVSRYAARLAGLPTASSINGNALSQKVDPLADIYAFSNYKTVFAPPAQAVEMPQEPEDAHLTGGTRSLSRRLLALNIPSLGTPQFKAGRKPTNRKPSILKPVTEN